jgi:YggT family protein
MLPNILLTILSIASSFYMTLVLLRFLLQLARADFYNPISQFLVKATDPPLRVVRKVVPGWGGIDGAAIVLSILIQATTFTLVLLLYDAGAALFNPAWLLAWSVLNVAGLVATLYFWAVIAVVVISWIAPGSSHPAIQLVAQITEPVMRPVRKVVPSPGGLDLSPIIVFLILQVVTVMIDNIKVAAGMPALLAGM